MNKIFEYHAALKMNMNTKYIIPNLKSKYFASIEEKWRVFIPFSIEDLTGYRK